MLREQEGVQSVSSFRKKPLKINLDFRIHCHTYQIMISVSSIIITNTYFCEIVLAPPFFFFPFEIYTGISTNLLSFVDQ